MPGPPFQGCGESRCMSVFPDRPVEKGGYTMKKPLLSIGIIFKNEIRCLERCLMSLKPLREAISCEVVMADTGSDDGSREVAEKYADILIDFPWIDDFAAARNAVLDRSSGEWFMTLDADEWFAPDVAKLVEFLQLPQKQYHLASFTIRNYKTPNVTNDGNFNEFCAMRIMRNGMGIRYEGCIHEHWKYPEALTDRQIVRLESLVYHDGYAFASKAAMSAKHDRNMALLEKKLKEDPNDLQTLTECMDATKTTDDESVDYARRALEVLHRDWERWGNYGARVYRDVVTVAQLRKLPELLEWAGKALELYPDSIYTRVDVAYCAYARSWDKKDAEGAVRWAEMYLSGLADYRGNNFDRSEMFRGHLEFAASFWERRLLVMQVEGYLNLKRYEDAFSTFECINGAELDEGQQVEACVNMLLRLHRITELNVEKLMARFWEQINEPTPSENMAQKRRSAFLSTAAGALTPHYQEDEAGREGFLRHSYTVLLPLAGKCILGDGAAILSTSDPAELEKRIAAQKLADLPISAFAHALKCGITFPLPGQMLTIEEMDALAARIAPLGKLLADLVVDAAEKGADDMPSLCWKRGLALAAVRSCDWKDEKMGMALCHAFSEIERAFLPRYYADDLLSDENIHLLPPMHRFGWYCSRAFWAQDAGNASMYVQLLRQGLEVCPEGKSMVEFLLRQLEESRKVQSTPELLTLAEQVRALLAQYPADDPAVEALKQSAAYQKVAHLIEGPELGVYGGIKQ